MRKKVVSVNPGDKRCGGGYNNIELSKKPMYEFARVIKLKFVPHKLGPKESSLRTRVCTCANLFLPKFESWKLRILEIV